MLKKYKNFFEPLNPYNLNKPLFKEEKKNILFYGISAKRYVLYKKKGNKILIEDGEDREYSLHGLGHLTNPFGKIINWYKIIWKDILKLHYGIITDKQFLEKFSDLFAISKLTVSTFGIMKRFKKFNKEKPYEEQIKPFNFFLIGIGNKDSVKPMTPYLDNPQEIVHKKFVDYKTGKILKGLEYWKSLSDTLWEYVNHKESKLEGNIGVLERKYVNVDGIVYIGKETENIEETGILYSPNYHSYLNEKELKEKILNLTTMEARISGLNKVTLWKIKKRILQHKPFKLYKKTLNKLKI